MSNDLSARWQELFWALPPGEMRHKLRALEIDIGRALRERAAPPAGDEMMPPVGYGESVRVIPADRARPALSDEMLREMADTFFRTDWLQPLPTPELLAAFARAVLARQQAASPTE